MPEFTLTGLAEGLIHTAGIEAGMQSKTDNRPKIRTENARPTCVGLAFSIYFRTTLNRISPRVALVAMMS